jgi:PAS domain S-box-containing protein
LPSHKSRNDKAWRLQLLIDAVVDYAIYMIDLDGRVATWNSGARRLKGYTAEEIIGQPFARFFTPEDRERELPQQALRIAAEVGRFESEGWRVRRDGSRFWALAVIDAVRDENGELIGGAAARAEPAPRKRASLPPSGSGGGGLRDLPARHRWRRCDLERRR